MIELLYLLILSLIAAGVGNRILSWFSHPPYKRGAPGYCYLEEQATCLGIGFGALTIFTFLLGAFQVLHPLSISLMLSVLLLIGRKHLLAALLHLKKGIVPEKLRFDRLTLSFMAVLAIMTTFNLIGALSPTTDTDGLAYHLAVPRFYLDHGGFSYHPIMVFNWPLSVEMLYTIALALSTDVLAKLMHFLFGLLSALAVYFFTKEWFGKPAGIMAAILFYAMPLVGIESGIAYVDLATTFYTVMGMLFFMRWYFNNTSNNIQILILSAIFIGIASSTKWNGPVTIAILFLFCLHKRFFTSTPHSSATTTPSCTFGTILLFLVISSSFSFMWYAKNLTLTGNPVAPFFGNIFPTRDWSLENSQAYRQSVASLYLSPLHFTLVPFALTFRGQLFGELTYLGPWFLMLLPLAFAVGAWTRPVSFIFLSSLFYYIVWFLTSQQSRLLLPTLALLSAVCGWIITHERLKPLHLILSALLLASVILALPFTVLYNGKGALVAAGIENRQTYLERLLPNAATLRYANEHLPPASKILLVRENHGFLLDKPYLWGGKAMQGVLDLDTLEPESQLVMLQRAGITHLIVNRAIVCKDPGDISSHCPDILPLLENPATHHHLNATFEKNNVTLYTLI